jgi:endonuclease/exonuclease/phosphatase (EEP) superfamily protein YafD
MMNRLKQRLGAEIKRIDIQRITIVLTTVIFIPILVCSCGAYFGKFDRLLELMTHFRFQYFMGAIVAAIIYGASKYKLGIWLALFCIGLNAIEVVPWYLPVERANDRTLRVAIANVLSSNRRYEGFVDYVRSTNPDVLVVMEMDLTWQQQIAPLKSLLPYTIEEPSSDNFGIALLSKFPLVDPQRQYWGEGSVIVPSLTANIKIHDRDITLVATHPVPPLNSTYFKSRNSQMEEMGSYIQKLGHEAIVMGDLNMSIWSPDYRKFTRRANLINTRQGFGIQPSWPSNFPLLQIPIDHCLITPTIKVSSNQIGPDIGSDHYPLIADLAIATKNTPKLQSS